MTLHTVTPLGEKTEAKEWRLAEAQSQAMPNGRHLGVVTGHLWHERSYPLCYSRDLYDTAAEAVAAIEAVRLSRSSDTPES